MNPGLGDNRSESKERHRRVRVIGVCSGKGGVGKTCIAVNVACVAAKLGERVLLLDADLGLSNAEILLGLRTEHHIGDVLNGADIRDTIVEGPAGIHLLSGGSGVSELTMLTVQMKQNLISALDTIEDHYDLFVIDGGAGIGANVRFFMGAAHERVLVVSNEPTSLADAYATLKVLAEAGVQEVKVVLNVVRGEAEARGVFSMLADVVSRHLTTRLTYLGAIPYDETVVRCVANQNPLVLAAPDAPASRAIWEVAYKFLNARPGPSNDGGLKFLWRRLLRESSS